MMRARGIRQPFAYLRNAGLPLGAVRKITNGTYARPPLDHIEKLCLVLQCTPNDILRWLPDKGQPGDVPLKELSLPDEHLEFLSTLQALPIDALKELGMKLRGE